MADAVQYLLGAGQLAVLGGIFHRMGNFSARISALENRFKPNILGA